MAEHKWDTMTRTEVLIARGYDPETVAGNGEHVEPPPAPVGAYGEHLARSRRGPRGHQRLRDFSKRASGAFKPRGLPKATNGAAHTALQVRDGSLLQRMRWAVAGASLQRGRTAHLFTPMRPAPSQPPQESEDERPAERTRHLAGPAGSCFPVQSQYLTINGWVREATCSSVAACEHTAACQLAGRAWSGSIHPAPGVLARASEGTRYGLGCRYRVKAQGSDAQAADRCVMRVVGKRDRWPPRVQLTISVLEALVQVRTRSLRCAAHRYLNMARLVRPVGFDELLAYLTPP